MRKMKGSGGECDCAGQSGCKNTGPEWLGRMKENQTTKAILRGRRRVK